MANQYQIINLEEGGSSNASDFSLDVLEGLSRKPKSIPSKYLYDEVGSHIFENIMDLKEYYPTRCELEIVQNCKNVILGMVGNAPFRLVELGVGDATKTRILLRYLIEEGYQFEYVPIDISHEMIEKVLQILKKEFQSKKIHITGIVAEYSKALSWLNNENPMQNIVLCLGGNIGNFDKKEVEHFLYQIWNTLNDGDSFFIGFDLKKDIKIIERAYDDASGVTREFNLNLLDRINRELNADFDRRQFMHHSFYNPSEGRMESWLLSKRAQKVVIGKLQKEFDFDVWEGIHTENSYKYNIKEIETLAKKMGFVVYDELWDSKGFFVDAIWQVKKIQSPIYQI